MTVQGVLTKENINKGTVVEIDQDEKEFEKLIELWVRGKISYETLQENIPTYDASMARKILVALLRRIDT